MARIYNAELVSKFLKNGLGFHKVLDKINVIKAEKGNCLASFKVSEEHLNPMGTLHGGMIATLVDAVSSSALLTHEKSGEVPSVSVDLHIAYMKSASLGEEVHIDAQTLHVGKKMAFLQCDIKNTTGNILVKATHTKYFPPFTPQ